MQTGIPLREAEPLLLFSILFTLFTAINPGAHHAFRPYVFDLPLMACICLFGSTGIYVGACILLKVLVLAQIASQAHAWF